MIYKFYQLLDEMDDLVLKTIVSSSQKPISVAGEHIDLTNNQYHICFYNIYHFGDIFFTQPFVKHICDSNPNVIFYYWLLQGHAVYDGIPNLICLEHDNDISSSISEKKNTTYYKFFYEEPQHFVRDLCTFDYRGKSFVAFNTWWSSLYYAEDMDYLFLLAGFKKKMLIFKKIFEISLNFDFDNHKMFPELRMAPLTELFSEWISINDKKNLVFIYNYEPRYITFMPKKVLNGVICDICRSNPRVHIIVPQYDAIFEDIENITCCDRDFGFIENRSCTNLLQIENILQYCRLVVTLPSGSSWTFMNKHISSYADKTAFYIWGDYTYYEKQLNNWYKYGTNKKDDIIQCVGINNLNMLIRNFQY